MLAGARSARRFSTKIARGAPSFRAEGDSALACKANSPLAATRQFPYATRHCTATSRIDKVTNTLRRSSMSTLTYRYRLRSDLVYPSFAYGMGCSLRVELLHRNQAVGVSQSQDVSVGLCRAQIDGWHLKRLGTVCGDDPAGGHGICNTTLQLKKIKLKWRSETFARLDTIQSRLHQAQGR